jgi:RNA polymerase sigma factor (sigma-70 family)
LFNCNPNYRNARKNNNLFPPVANFSRIFHNFKVNLEITGKNSEKSDADLLRACKNGDEPAWNKLVERYQRLIATIPRRAGLSEDQTADVFQEVFLTLFQKMHEIEQPEKLRAWLVTTAKFKTWGIIRGQKNIHSPETEEAMEAEMANLSDNSPLADEVLIELEQQHLIRAALNKMDERCQNILAMIYLRNVAATYAEVAAGIGVGESSVSPLRTRCLDKLAKILKN